MHLYKVKFNSPLHIGKGRSGEYDSGEDILHSDTLKSAILVVALDLFGDSLLNSPEKISRFFDSFRLSSAFPYLREELFFPKPISVKLKSSNSQQIEGSSEVKGQKKIKKIKYLSSDIFNQVLQGKDVIVDENNVIDDSFLSKEKAIIKLKGGEDKKKNVYKSEVLQRVTIDRFGGDNDAEPYYIEQLFFEKDAGLFFLVEWVDEGYMDIFNKALLLLGEQGVGMDRSTGCGAFSFDKKNVSHFYFDATPTPNAYVNLSLYCPTKDESESFNFGQGEDNNEQIKTAYELIKRGGYITSFQEYLTFRKKSIYMFKEGSVFSFVDKSISPQGKCEKNMAPEELLGRGIEVWREGRSIFVPIKLKQHESH